ncbi:polycystic kidney disease 1 like 1 [Pangasianodon hypophthalmus]|uniref:polycystic kidney disease 1 like 1 n=1 Tax=Pangasianodon hypophthalmus TaxID=310915 RepID=UPI002307BA05|nr:polycystic kidney disease 1 like 1 [Pangasianodon hypophthalmus]
MSLQRPRLLDVVPTIQHAAALALGRPANYNDDLSEALGKGDVLPQPARFFCRREAYIASVVIFFFFLPFFFLLLLISIFSPVIWIYTEKQAYTTREDIKFLAMTEEPDPLEFHWHFGDKTTIRTPSRTFIKKYLHPDRYNVTVSMSSSLGSVSSDVYTIVIQRAVRLNRLRYTRSVLLNTTVTFSCRINAGTGVTYLWDFGDGTQRVGQDTEHHVFNSTGEFIVEVIVYNLVSSASLKGHVFVVLEPCQPPPVKNMGPSKIQVWRYQPVCLGVTYEEQIQCNTSKGLHYSWTLYGPTGLQLSTTGIKTNQQHLELPEYLLHYGTYRAVAKVQVVGSIVYSTYSVLIEVMPSALVSIISGGTNVFINRHNSNSNITVDGHRSYDPDFPDNIMSYRWKCRPVNTAETSCFSRHVPVSSALLMFPASALNSNCDLFKLTLTVQSGNRSSSSEMFITMSSKPTSIIHVSCKECRGNSVNWNERFSVTAACESCPINVTYFWKLYLVNASSKSTPDVPFCGSLDISLPSKLEEDTLFFQEPANTASLSILNQKETSGNEIKMTRDSVVSWRRWGRSVEHQNPSLLDLLSVTDSASAETGSGDMNEMDFALFHLPVPTEDKNPRVKDFVAEYPDEHGYLDYEDFYSGIKEADSGVSVGRPTGPHNLDDVISHSSEYDGDNLVGPGSLGHVVSEKTLLDLHRELIQPALFESFTSTGISSSVITFKPMMLKPKSLYMLEVSASSEQVLQGKTQLFFSTYPAPEGMVCHVQPSSGFEVHTHFSVFCTSGKEDLLYEYSFRVGNSTKKLLYKGRDYQHYFYLPSGHPYDDYKVTIYITIGNRFGASTKPCPVNVKVWPSFKRNSMPFSNPDQELFVYGLSNLTNLIQMKNTQDIINYIFFLTATLNRLSLDPESCVKLQTQTRAALISAICQLDATNQELLFDILHTLVDLMKVSNQVTFDSAILVTKYIQNLSSLRESNLLDVWVLKALIRILSYILEAQIPSSRLTLDVLHITTDSVLTYLVSSREPQFSVNTTFIKLVAWQNCDFPITRKNVDLTTFHIPHMPVIKHTSRDYDQKSCFITLIISYRQTPYHWARTPLQVNGHVADMKLFNCSTRREIKMRHLSTPIIIEFQKQEERNSTDVEFTLTRSEVNTHQFNITAELLKKAVQIRVEFRRPSRRVFPILLLFRMHQRPTPSLYNVRKVYHWKGQVAQIFLPASSLKDPGIAYLMLLNADYDKSARNKYIADEVDYTLSIDSTQCLVWDGVKDWRSDGCSVLQSFTSTKVNCSYNQLSSFTVAHQMIQSIHSLSDITEYMSIRANPMVCIVIVVLVALYTVLLVFCKHADVQVEKNLGTFLLPDNNPSDQFLYAVTIDTGLRSRARMTAKVHIVLYGEKGVSQTRELSNPDHTLFTRNSRTTFILSSAQSLGQIWQVCVWHDGGGMSPSWFLNHVMVKDIVDGSSWTFLAQCWLAVDEGDGRVERKLLALNRQLTFRELLHLNLSDCLEDLHPWLSVYSRPSYSTHTHTQRLSVCFLLLQAYMCANCILTYLQEDQCWLESGLIGVSLLSVWTGLCALTLLPLGFLVSFLFRICKINKNGSHSGDQYKVRIPHIFSLEDDRDAFLLRDSVSELNVSWSRVSPWKNKSEVLKACDLESMSCSKLPESSALQKATDSISCIEIIEENIPDDNDKLQSELFKNTQFNLQASSLAVNSFPKNSVSRRSRTLQAWCYYGTWALWLCLCVTCVIITGILGLKFSSTKCLLWIHSVFFSLLFCAFAAHPAMIFIVAVSVTLRHGDQGYFCKNSADDEPIIELLKNSRQNGACVKKQPLSSSYHPTEEISMNFEKVLAARQRARYLRLARPPTSTELQSVRSQIKKRTLLQKTIRELVFYMFASSIVGFVAYGKSSNDKFLLNQAVRARFTGSPSIQKLDDWWNWTANTLLHELYLYSHDYNGLEDKVKTVSLIGEPVIMKMEGTHNSSCQSSSGALASVFNMFTEPHRCGKLRCYEGAGFNVSLGKNRSEASIRLKKLWTSGWMGSSTHAVMLQFTVYSPVYNLFTTVTMLGEMSCMGAVLSSVFIYSTRLHHSASALDYCTTAAELLLLLLTLLQLYFQTYVIAQRGRRYWTDLWKWIEVIVVLLSLLCFVCSVHHFTLIADTMEHLQREDFKTFVDFSPASSWEQCTHSLYGLLMFILLIKCCSLLRLNEAMTTAVSTVIVIFSSLLWPLVTGVILVFAFSSLGKLLTLPKSVYSVITHGFGIRKLGDLHKNQASWMLCCYGALICVVSFAVKAMITGVLSSAVKRAKHKRRKHHLSISELCTYIRDMALALVGKGRQKWTVHTNSNNFVLEEFEDLVDELLLKLNVISSSNEEQDNYEDQSPLQSAYDYSSEVGDENKMEDMEIMPSVCCEFLYPYEESSLRSLLEWNTLQRFRRSGETIRDWAFYADQKAHQNISTSPVQKLKDSETSLCIHRTLSVYTEGSERLKADRSEIYKLTRKDNDCDNTIPNKAFSSQLPIGFISPTENLTNHLSHRESCRQFCLYESHVQKQVKQDEEENVGIPGQCC